MPTPDDQKMRILEIIHEYKHELGLKLKGNGKAGVEEQAIWSKIMQEAKSQSLYSGTEVVKFKEDTWCRWRGDAHVKFRIS